MSCGQSVSQYITFSSNAFLEIYPDNSWASFKNNLLLLGLDNAHARYECALIAVYLQNVRSRADAIYKITASFVKPYQFGDKTCQIAATIFLPSYTPKSCAESIQQAITGLKSELRLFSETLLAERRAAIALATAESQRQKSVKSKAQAPTESSDAGPAPPPPPPAQPDQQPPPPPPAKPVAVVSPQTPTPPPEPPRTSGHYVIDRPVYFPVPFGQIVYGAFELRTLWDSNHTATADKTTLLFHFRIPPS